MAHRIPSDSDLWTPQTPKPHRPPGEITDLTEAAKKMIRNAFKAMREWSNQEDVITPLRCLVDMAECIGDQPPLTLSHFASAEQGSRRKMEDAHFFTKIPQGTITGVFDGHGGKDVAEFANYKFQEIFSSELTSNNNNVHQAFELALEKIHLDAIANPAWKYQGTTAVICFIQQDTNCIYTATIGDSEALIARKVDKQHKIVPLSCVRNWKHPKEAARAARGLDNLLIATTWPNAKDPKALRVPNSYGINLSRALGDRELTGTPDKPLLIHKPKITLQRLKPGDTLIIACDGLFDFMSSKDILDSLEKNKNRAELAQELVRCALDEKRSTDNVTAVIVHVDAII